MAPGVNVDMVGNLGSVWFNEMNAKYNSHSINSHSDVSFVEIDLTLVPYNNCISPIWPRMSIQQFGQECLSHASSK